MNFSDIIGQNEIIEILRAQLVNNKVGHAYIFSGPSGIGKSFLARIFAGVLLCDHSYNSVRCEKCQACRLFENSSNPDFYTVVSDGQSISVENIRNMQKDIMIRPLYSERKVYLISDAEKMTPQAQNCLLKTLEEPPGYAVIILTTSNYNGLLETIRSRGVRHNFKKNSFSEIKDFLSLRVGSNFEGIDFITSYADGVIGRAIELLESEEFKDFREKAIQTVLKLNETKLSDIFNVYGFFEDNKDNVDTILDIMIIFYRDILIFKKSGNENMLINSDKKDIILNIVDKFSTGKLVKNIQVIENTLRMLKQNANYQLAMEVMLMKLQEEI